MAREMQFAPHPVVRRSGLTPIRPASCSYAMDVNVERAEDVLTHRRLLEQAKDPAQRPAFAVRAVQVMISECNSQRHLSRLKSRRSQAHVFLIYLFTI